MNCGPISALSRAPRRERGFTLTELLAVVTIAAVLAAVALPNMSEFVKNNARSSRLNDLVAAMNFARGVAVTQGVRHKICASTDKLACSGSQFRTAALVMRWNAGTAAWDRARTFNIDAGAKVAITGDVAEVIFEPTGMKSTTASNVKFVHCDDRGAGSARAIVVSATGHPSISTDSDADGTDDINGVALTCPVL